MAAIRVVSLIIVVFSCRCISMPGLQAPVVVGALEHDATVECATFLGLVVGDGLALAGTRGGEAAGGDALGLEVVGHGLGTALGELLVVGLGAGAVGVADDAAGDELQPGEGLGDLVEGLAALVGEFGGIEGELHLAGDVAGAALRADTVTLRGIRALVGAVDDTVAVAVGRRRRRRRRGWRRRGGRRDRGGCRRRLGAAEPVAELQLVDDRIDVERTDIGAIDLDVGLDVHVPDSGVDEEILRDSDVQTQLAGEPEGVVGPHRGAHERALAPLVEEHRVVDAGADVGPPGALRVEVVLQAQGRQDLLDLADPRIPGAGIEVDIVAEGRGAEHFQAPVVAEHVGELERGADGAVHAHVTGDRAAIDYQALARADGQVVGLRVDQGRATAQQPVPLLGPGHHRLGTACDGHGGQRQRPVTWVHATLLGKIVVELSG